MQITLRPEISSGELKNPMMPFLKHRMHGWMFDNADQTDLIMKSHAAVFLILVAATSIRDSKIPISPSAPLPNWSEGWLLRGTNGITPWRRTSIRTVNGEWADHSWQPLQAPRERKSQAALIWEYIRSSVITSDWCLNLDSSANQPSKSNYSRCHKPCLTLLKEN